MASTDSKLTVNFEILGHQETTRIKEWSIDSAYTTSTDGFSFSIYPDLTDPQMRDLELQPVELLVNGASQLKGRIDKTTIGDDGSAVRCEGRDYIADLVECNVDPTFKIKESMTLGVAMLTLTEPVGILAILGDDDVGMQNIRTGTPVRRKKRKNKTKTLLQDLQPRPTEGMYEFANRLCARHATTIQPAAERTVLLLNAPDYDQEPAYTIHVTADQRRGTKNNVVTAVASRDYSKFPTFTLANGKQARSADKPTPIMKTYDLIGELVNEEMARIITSATVIGGRQLPGNAVTTAPQLYRLLHIEDIDARNADELDAAVLRATAERLKDTLIYEVTLQGHLDPDTNSIYSVNTMCHVIDEIRGIDEPLWVASRRLDFSPGSGATTRMTLWRPGSFQIENEAN